MMGLHVYMGGVGAQQLFVLIFVVCAIVFHLKIIRQQRPDMKKALLLLYVLYACLALITVSEKLPCDYNMTLIDIQLRICFRLAEYSQGLTSTIPLHEAYQYCLDSLPMLIALVLLNAVHPGRIMPGKDSDMPSRKQRKTMTTHTKARVSDDEIVCTTSNALCSII
jgi:hypothetical protein